MKFLLGKINWLKFIDSQFLINESKSNYDHIIMTIHYSDDSFIFFYLFKLFKTNFQDLSWSYLRFVFVQLWIRAPKLCAKFRVLWKSIIAFLTINEKLFLVMSPSELLFPLNFHLFRHIFHTKFTKFFDPCLSDLRSLVYSSVKKKYKYSRPSLIRISGRKCFSI